MLDLDGVLVDADNSGVHDGGDAKRAELPFSARREAFCEPGEDAWPGLYQQDACSSGVRPAVVPREHVTCELGDLPGHLDSGRSGSDNHERQPRRARGPIPLGIGRLEREEDPVAQLQRSLQRLQLGREAGPSVVPEVRVARTGGDGKDVIPERDARAAVRQAGDLDDTRCHVERGHLAEDDLRVALPAQGRPERNRHLGGRKGSRRDLVNERLKEKEVLPVDKRHPHIRPPQPPNGEQPTEPSTDNKYLAHGPQHHRARNAGLLQCEAGR